MYHIPAVSWMYSPVCWNTDSVIFLLCHGCTHVYVETLTVLYSCCVLDVLTSVKNVGCRYCWRPNQSVSVWSTTGPSMLAFSQPHDQFWDTAWGERRFKTQKEIPLHNTHHTYQPLPLHNTHCIQPHTTFTPYTVSYTTRYTSQLSICSPILWRRTETSFVCTSVCLHLARPQKNK